MTWKHHIAAASIALPALVGAQAGAPSGISVDRQPARAGEPLRVTVNFEAASSLCGLRVDFGDGDVRHVVAERFPLSFLKHYVSPGRYLIRAEGRGLLQGLQSAFGCAGAPRTLSLQVVGSGSTPPAGTRPQGIPATPVPGPASPPAPPPSSPPPSTAPPSPPRVTPPPVVDRAPTPVPAPAPAPPPAPGRSRDESLRVF